MPDVFLSYARPDRERVRVLAEALTQEGLDVWWDPDIVTGVSFHKLIEQKLAESKCIVVAWSMDAVRSDWVMAEAEEGRARGILAPVTFDDVKIPVAFRALQTADLTHWHGNRADGEYLSLLSGIARLVGADQVATGRTDLRPQGIHGSIQRRRSLGWALAPSLPMRQRYFGAAAFLVALLWILGPLSEPVQFLSFDTYQRILPWVRTNPRAVVIDIDQESLRQFGDWPWPGSLLAQLLERTRDAGATAIAFDFLLTDRSQQKSAASSSDATAHNDVAELAKAIGQSRVVLASIAMRGPRDHALMGNGTVTRVEHDALRTLTCFSGSTRSGAAFSDAAAGMGNVVLPADSDNTVRRLFLIAGVDADANGVCGRIIPSLALEAVRVAEDSKLIGFSVPGRKIAITAGTIKTEALSDGEFWIHFSAPERQTHLSAYDVLHSDGEGSMRRAISGKIVVVGVSAPGLSNLRSTPLTPESPSADIQANVIDQILEGHVISRTRATRLIELISLALVSGLFVLLLPRVSPALGGIAWLLVATNSFGLGLIRSFSVVSLSTSRLSV